MPNTSSPTLKSVTPAPTSSARRTPMASPRVTVDTWTLTSTSSSFGTGRSTSATRSTSGGPYRSWTTALLRSLPLRLDAMDGCAVLPSPPGAVKLSGPSAARPGSRRAAGRDHPTVLAQEAAAEVRGVELHAPDRLVHRSQLGHREGRADKARGDARDLELDADALDCVADDSQVVERELGPLLEDVRGGDERCVCRVGAGEDRPHVAKDGEVRDGDDVHARVASGIAVGAVLGQRARDVDARLLGELASRRLVQRLFRTLEPTGNRPHSLMRRLPPPDEKNVEYALGHGQDDHVHRDGEGRELARVVPVDARLPRSCRHDSYPRTRFKSCQPKRPGTRAGCGSQGCPGEPRASTRPMEACTRVLVEAADAELARRQWGTSLHRPS